jgi:hypothetical protein
MPLTKPEREFLDAYVFEATNGPPFGGPATKDLAQRDIFYEDLHWILTAYDRECCAEKKWPMGTYHRTPPPSPWENLEQAKLRNQVLKEELETKSQVDGVKEQTPGLQKARR